MFREVVVRSFGPIAVAVILVSGLRPAVSQERPFTPALTCSAVKSIVLKEQNVALATSQTAYEMVHANSMDCASDEASVPAFEPTSDNPNCLAGWRCRQHNSDGNK